MHRSLKRLIYGIFYLALFILIVGGPLGLLSGPTPTCTDGVQNQNETGVDCGGACTPCEITSLDPLRPSSFVEIFHLSDGRATFIGSVTNPNEMYEANRFSYSFTVTDASGKELETIEGFDSVFPLERRNIFSGVARTPFKKIGNVTFTVSRPEWKTAYEGLRPDVVLSEPAKTEIGGETIKVTGKVKNRSSAVAESIHVIGRLADKYDIGLFASQSSISNIEGFGETSFTILMPNDPEIADRVDPSRTQIFVSAR
jgi:hypothetical protein